MTDALARLAAALSDRYRVERQLGQGGMATVYLAQDLKHDRKVAIKVLRPELAAVIGADRFLSEIRTTANLQHPHILPLFDSGVASTADQSPNRPIAEYLYYVMPFIEGETLRDRLTREKQLPVADAVRIATEVAGALDYAHRHGVIHRDIKPENILLHDGRALVADFGIALAASNAGGTRLTETGLSLGTPLYMSPEQAMAEREITARCDIYALGCVTYEMLIGEPPFTGPTAQAIVAKVMTAEAAPLTEQRKSIPAPVEAAVLTALAKLPADRYSTAAEFAAAMAEDGPIAARRAAARSRGGDGRSAQLRNALVVGFGVIAAVSALFAWRVRHGASGTPAQVVRFTIPAVTSDRTSSLGYNSLAVSPDGTTLVYVGDAERGRRQLVARGLDRVTARPLPGTEDGANPFFSPDGKWVGFFRGNQIFKVAVDGGAPQLLAPAPGTFDGASWALDGRIIVSGNLALYAIPENGGPAALLPRLERVPGEVYRTAPLVLGDGRHLLYASWSGSAVTSVRMAILSLKTGEATVLDLPGIHPLGVVDGVLVYVTAGGLLMGVRVDIERGKILGTPVQLADNLATNASTGLARAALSPAGTLIYQSGAILSRVVVVGPNGRTRLGLEDNRDYTFPRLSPDGKRLALSIGAAGNRDVWVYELGAGTLTRITTSGPSNERVEWSPDGKRVLFRADQGGRVGIWWRPVDLSAEATPLVSGKEIDVFEGLISPDSRYVAYQLDTLGADIYYRGLVGDTTPHPVANSVSAIETMPRIAHDGRWIAFVTNESGRDEVVVQPFPGPGGRVQVSTAGGTEPLWSRDGRKLFYRGSGHLMAAIVRPGPTFDIVSRDSVLTDNYLFALNPHPNYDVLPDGAHFIFLEPSDAGEMTVAANWLPVLRSRMAGETGR